MEALFFGGISDAIKEQKCSIRASTGTGAAAWEKIEQTPVLWIELSNTSQLIER
jgi:hypothetical protein